MGALLGFSLYPKITPNDEGAGDPSLLCGTFEVPGAGGTAVPGRGWRLSHRGSGAQGTGRLGGALRDRCVRTEVSTQGVAVPGSPAAVAQEHGAAGGGGGCCRAGACESLANPEFSSSRVKQSTPWSTLAGHTERPRCPLLDFLKGG